MNLSFYIARRYLFAKKSHNAINIISYISVGGVALGTMALIVVLSVFNGFDNLVRSLYNSFNPDLVISLKEGKAFRPDSTSIFGLKKIAGVVDYAEVLEDRALVRNGEKQTIATVKGVSYNYTSVSGIDSMVRQGEFSLEKKGESYSVIGQGIAWFLDVSLDVNLIYRPELAFYVPDRKSKGFSNPERDINRGYLIPHRDFAIEQEFDSKYILVPIDFARDLFGFPNEVTAIEVKVNEKANEGEVQKAVEELFGNEFMVKTDISKMNSSTKR
ncbi:MAG: hypothetical protein HC906_18700 [Bacteroidales bacterium]|nr:hypothetical protein [Bacteroidales bacterium]